MVNGVSEVEIISVNGVLKGCAARVASKSRHCSNVISAGAASRGSDAFVSPSVT